MNDDAKYALPVKWLYKLSDQISEHGEQPVQQDILTGIIQELHPDLYRAVFRSIIKTVYASGDGKTAGCLSRKLVRGFDYANVNERARKKERSEVHSPSRSFKDKSCKGVVNSHLKSNKGLSL